MMPVRRRSGLGLAQHVQTTADLAARAYWESRARDWRIAVPLKPAPEDVAWYERCAADCARSAGSKGLTAVLLGATPGIASMAWMSNTTLIAVDWAEGMLRHVWPHAQVSARSARLCADWRALPIAADSVDLAIGDGCYSAVGSLADARRLSREVARILRPGGLFCMRTFCRTEPAPSVAALFDELESGRVVNLDLFRWRLAMAVHGDTEGGVTMHDVWRVWRDHLRGARSQDRNWPAEQRLNMERWEGVSARHCFPSIRQLRELAEPGCDLVACDWPDYESAEHFPRLLMRAR